MTTSDGGSPDDSRDAVLAAALHRLVVGSGAVPPLAALLSTRLPELFSITVLGVDRMAAEVALLTEAVERRGGDPDVGRAANRLIFDMPFTEHEYTALNVALVRSADRLVRPMIGGPRLVRWLVELGEHLASDGRHAEAAAEIGTAVELARRLDDVDGRRILAQCLLLLGDHLGMAGRLREAVTVLRECLRAFDALDPSIRDGYREFAENAEILLCERLHELSSVYTSGVAEGMSTKDHRVVDDRAPTFDSRPEQG